MIASNILNRIKQAVHELEPQAEVILFGSRTRGDARTDSDWDILILVPYAAGLKEEQRFRHQLFEVELEFGQAISTFVKSKADWESTFRVTPLYREIAKEGMTI